MDNKDEIARYAKLSIVPLDQSVPPSNGAEWVSSVLAVYAETGLEHFTLAAFCKEFIGVDMNSVMHRYVAMLRDEASDGVVKKEVVKKEVVMEEVGASPSADPATEFKQGAVSDDISEMQFGVENEQFSDSDMALIRGSTNTRSYGCPLKKPWAAESLQSRKLRMYADRLIRQSLVHHPHLHTGVPLGDIAEILRLGRGFALGSSAKLAVARCKQLFTMSKKSDEPMSKFAARIISLESKMFQVGSDPNFSVGKSLYVHAVLAMCDNEPSLATELALLRKQECRSNPLTLAQALENLGRACAQPKKALAFQGKVMYCHDYNNGRCRRGATECRFVHQKDPAWVDHPKNSRAKTRDRKKEKCGVPGCDMDRSAHAIKDCPVFAALARSTSTVSPVPPRPSAPPAPSSSPDPKVKGDVAVPVQFDALDAVYGIDHTLASLTGIGMPMDQ